MLEECLEKYALSDPWDVVDLFEKTIADYAGSKYAVTVDSCTNAMFLCLKYLKYEGEVEIPARTYVSVPCTIIHAGCQVKFIDESWEGAYQLKPTPVYDGAVHMSRGMYKENTYLLSLMCCTLSPRLGLPDGEDHLNSTRTKSATKAFHSTGILNIRVLATAY